MESNEWKEYRFSELVEIIGGGTPKTNVEKYWNGDIPWLSVKDFNSDNRKIYYTEKTITKEGLKNSSTNLLEEGDLIISARGTVGALAQLGRPMAFNQSCYGLKAKKITSNDFIYYLLKYKIREIKQNIHGSVFDTITRNTFDVLTAKIPNIKEQKAIANILSTLDEKIETNNKINKKLEEMAQALFKHWFVDFEFPNENGEPYKSSGGEMVDSELGMIPKGWEIVNLEDLTSKFTTGLNPRKNFVLGKGENYYVTIKNMGNNQIYLDDKCDKIDNDAIKKINKRSDLKKGDLLFSGIGTIGRVYLIDETPENWNISESIFTLRPSKLISSEILYLLLLSEQLQGYAQQLASGSVQKGVRMRDLKAYKLAIPSNCLIEKFTELIRPLIRKNKYLEKENKRLKAIRDTLLPRLLSGEIRVPLDNETLVEQS